MTTPATPDVELDLTALHEAGHAIVGKALGFRVHEVGLNGGLGGGYCASDEPPHDTLDAIQRDLTFTVAGRLAVALEQGEDWRQSLGDPLLSRRGLSLLNTIELESSSGVHASRGTGMGYRDYVAAASRLLGDDPAGPAGSHWMRKALPAAAEEAVRILREHWPDVQGLAIRLAANGTVDLGEGHRRESLERAIERAELAVIRGQARARRATGR